MKPHQRRRRLFKTGEPTISQVHPGTAQWTINWQWVAYKGSGGDLSEVDFKQTATQYLGAFDFVFNLEDRNEGFSGKAGPVGFVGCLFDGWNLRPHIEWYPWATTRNKLRCQIAFLFMARRKDDIGFILMDSDRPVIMKKLRKYIGIYKAGQIEKGYPDRSDKHIYYIRGASHGIPDGSSDTRRGNGAQRYTGQQGQGNHADPKDSAGTAHLSTADLRQRVTAGS